LRRKSASAAITKGLGGRSRGQTASPAVRLRFYLSGGVTRELRRKISDIQASVIPPAQVRLGLLVLQRLDLLRPQLPLGYASIKCVAGGHDMEVHVSICYKLAAFSAFVVMLSVPLLGARQHAPRKSF
jgi:hypothetical protein